MMIGTKSADRSSQAWRQTYRALEHGKSKAQCKEKGIIAQFPNALQDFANMFVELQAKRHDADYDPEINLLKSSVFQDLLDAEEAITQFKNVSIKDRRAFAAWVLFKKR
jgi:hypothetical protein